MPDDKKLVIEKLGLQEFPSKKQEIPGTLETLPKKIEQMINKPETGSFEREVRKVEEPGTNEGKSQGEIGGIVLQGNAAQKLKEREKEIDRILSEGLEEMYLAMTAEKRIEFKQAGEETTRKINVLLTETKVKVKKIIDLIRNWLSMLPGVNKFFLEQEIKIRTDKIMDLKNK